MVVVALAIVAGRSVLETRRLQRKVTVSDRRIQQLETQSALRRDSVEQEFFGLHDEPILAIDLRVANSCPRLLRILNCKYSPQNGFFQVGSEKTEIRQLAFDLRLLRTLDGKDYYRLVVDPRSRKINFGESASDEQKTVLFQYDGTPQVLLADDSCVIAIAQDRESSLESVLSTYDPQYAKNRRPAWQSDGIVHTLFSPSVRETVLSRSAK